jgi:PAS domain S-box-containing protein
MSDNQRFTILCVDDDEAARYSVTRTLRLGGYHVVEGRTGADALRLAAGVPDLITLDVNLPDINGFEVCRQIKANPQTAQVPILHVSSSCVEPKDRVRGLDGGADGYVTQPLNGEELLAIVNALLRLKGAEREARLRAEEAEGAKEEVAGLNQKLRETVEQLRIAQTKIAEREERLRVAQHTAHSGSWEWNFRTGEVIWSPEEERVYGLEPGSFSGDITEWPRMVHPDDLVNIEKLLQDAIDTHAEFHVEFRVNRADGALRWIESFGQIFYDDHGKPQRMVGANTDITERKNIEEVLRTSEFRFRRLVDSNIIPILCANMQGVTEANDAFLAMVGYTRDDLVAGKIDWVKMTPAEHVAKDAAAIEELKSKGFCTPYEKEYTLRDGTRVPFLIGATVLSPEPLEWLCFIVELSELKRVEGELRKAHDELEKKVTERTRELAETVTSLKSEMGIRKRTEQQLRELSARLLRLQDEERRRIARELHDSTGQTLTILKLTLASLEPLVSGIPRAVELVNDLNAVADQAVQEIRTTSHLLYPPLLDELGFSSAAQWYVEGFGKRSGIKSSLDISATPQLTKDAELVFFRILQESLTNVLRHSGSTAVDIRLYCDDADAILTVRDYGKGIASEKLSSFRETGAGVGVGLGGMKQRVRELGGHLRVDCDGTGTCVTASLPLKAVRHTSQSRESNGTGQTAPST